MTMPRPTPPAPKQLRFGDLVDAYFLDARYRAAARELADYHALRLRVLADLFRCDLSPVESERAAVEQAALDRDDVRDREQVATIARSCLREYMEISGPFGFYMEGRPGPLEQRLVERHRAKMNAAIGGCRKRFREIFADCVRTLHPGIERRKVSEAALIERGVPAEAPDPDEFF